MTIYDDLCLKLDPPPLVSLFYLFLIISFILNWGSPVSFGLFFLVSCMEVGANKASKLTQNVFGEKSGLADF